MPLVIKAQTSRNLDQVSQGQYQFFEENRQGWCDLWKEMDGDREKILDWANKMKIEFPEEWYTGLHNFLFSVSSGDEELLKQTAAAKSFSDFLAQVAEDHLKNPKETEWYVNQCTTPEKFLSAIQGAAEIDLEETAREYLNSRIMGIGSKLYDEYLLALTGYEAETKETASSLNRKAHKIEKKFLARRYQPGQKIQHALHPGVELTVIGQMKDNSVLAQRRTGALSHIKDVWNLQAP